MIRNRQSGEAARVRELKAQASALSSPANQAEFRAGFDRFCADVKSGMTGGAALDLATSPGATRAYSQGANAALDLLDGDGSYAKKLTAIYGVKLG